MENHQQIQSYLLQLLQWVESAQKEWKSSCIQRNKGERLLRAEEQMENELERIKEDILTLQSKRVGSTPLVEEVAKIKSRAEQFYQGWERVASDSRTTPEERQAFFSNSQHVPYSPVPIGGHQLPPLPYDYTALEPYISEEIMRLHHTKHHQSYVDGLNKAEKKMLEARQKGNYELIRHWEREAAFHGAGHYLHTIFWNNMSPAGGGVPHGELAKQIEKDFGSFDLFKSHFTHAAKEVEGVGWAILVWAPRSHRLEILQAEKHQFLSQWDVIPILVLDVWEHAYYLQYKADKEKYIQNWWNVVNWKYTNERFKKAKEIRWEPY
ncbi:superoxide dismutase [Caldalkalibacillus mannanilyticus]|uniref:superoxide dismutase n=1 Tax=Caldalkalibacillus mannanilyticus TaxID=1418 RepID=UPI00046989F2|nr:superoxide dismutase [Caldalkalibacillus mannanilyticus]